MSTGANPPPPANQPPTEEKITMGSLRKVIAEEIKNLLPGNTGTNNPPTGGNTGTTDAPDIRTQVKTALEQIKSKEDRDARDAKIDDFLAKSAEVKPEEPPKQQRFIEKLMGWGE